MRSGISYIDNEHHLIMKVLVTGGAGFIGSNLTEHLPIRLQITAVGRALAHANAQRLHPNLPALQK